MDWYKHYMGDYAKDTAHLTLLQHGAYRVLIDHYYATEGPLPSDSESLYRIARAFTKPERDAVDYIVDAFFTYKAGLYHKSRIDREIEKYANRSAINRRNAQRNESESPTESVSNTRNQKPETRNHDPDDQKKTSRRENKFSDDDLGIAEWMFDHIRQLNPKHKQPNFEKWANSLRLIRERDGKTNYEIMELFEWANNDPFWQNNILSPDTLRKQWDKLTLQKNQKKPEKKNDGSDTSNHPRNVERRAAELGIQARPGESYDDLHRRCCEKERQLQ